VFADHLEVEVRGAPRPNVALHEVGLRSTVEMDGVGGPCHRLTYRSLAARSLDADRQLHDLGTRRQRRSRDSQRLSDEAA
jgi:hypothetical protein